MEGVKAFFRFEWDWSVPESVYWPADKDIRKQSPAAIKNDDSKTDPNRNAYRFLMEYSQVK